MHIQVDSREKARAIKKILSYFDQNGIKHFVSKLPCGDYMSLDSPRLVIDRKHNLLELAQNVSVDHKRFASELVRAEKLGIKLIFLCEHSKHIRCLEDIRGWVNPRLKVSPMAVSGERLYKILSTMEKTYGTRFLFCNKDETGRRIAEILGGQNG